MVSEKSASAQLLDFLAWLNTNQKRVLVATGIVVFVIIVAGVLIYNQARREVRASEALSNIDVPANPSKPPRSGLAEDYQKFAQEYAGTKAAARAILQGAGVLYTDGRFADAQKQFERLLREYSDSPWIAEAHLGVAASLEAQQKSPEAIAKYEEVRRRFANAAIADEAKLALGRLYEATNPSEAFKLYDELTKANPYSGLGAEAGMRQADLVETHPELKPKPPAPVTPSIVMTNPPIAGSNRVITLTNLMRLATNAPNAGTNMPSATGTNQTLSTNIPLLIKPNPPTNNP
jgi:predicted negative regulator of RcsB-dependent stress response